MKKFLITTLVLLMAIPCYGAIEKTAVEAQATNLLSRVKGKLMSDSVNYTSMRQKIEDILADYVANLDGPDQTKLNALPNELQDVIDAIDDLITKINTHYPSVE